MPRKKNMRIRVNARIASKVREKDLMEKAKALMEDPELILPECAAECGSCPFKKTRARLEKVSKYKDDPAKLAKFAKRGDRLARAYAATIGLVHEEKAPYLASAKYPGGTVMFALRGRTSKEKLIGVQNYDSPKWRVLGVLDLVKKKGLHFYSYGDEFVCTGREPKPPEGYIAKAADAVGATRKDDGGYSCPHASPSVERIEFAFVNTDSRVSVCPQCGAKNGNSLTKLAEGMAVPSILDEVDVTVERPLAAVAGSKDLRGLLSMPVEHALLEKYASGQIGDRELIDMHFEQVHVKVEARDGAVYVRGDRSFGDDRAAFIAEMTEDPVESSALSAMLADIEHPVVADPKDTVNSVMSRFWSDHGLAALKGVVPAEVAEAHFKDDDESAQSPLKVVRLAVKKAAHAEVTSRMPSYSGLSQHARFVDEVTRAYKTRGSSGANALLDADTSNDHRTRSIAHAFYLSMGISTKSWKYTSEEQEFGKHLAGAAKRLLESQDSEAHHAAFVAFMKEAGSTEEIKRSS